MKIYGSLLSPFVARVILACDHKGLNYDIEMPAGGLKTADFLAMNPFGKMPTIKIGRATLYESDVIVSYLDEAHPKKKIIPGSAATASKARLIARISDLYVQAPTLKLFRQVIGRSPKNAAEANEAKEELNKGLDVLNGYIKPGPCATGRSFTIADCYTAPALLFVSYTAPQFNIKDPYKGRPNIKKYWSAIKKYPSARAQMAAMQAMMRARLGS